MFFIKGTDKQNALKHDCIYNIDMLFEKKGSQAFIYIYDKSFDKHKYSSPTGSFYTFCILSLEIERPKVH